MIEKKNCQYLDWFEVTAQKIHMGWSPAAAMARTVAANVDRTCSGSQSSGVTALDPARRQRLSVRRVFQHNFRAAPSQNPRCIFNRFLTLSVKPLTRQLVDSCVLTMCSSFSPFCPIQMEGPPPPPPPPPSNTLLIDAHCEGNLSEANNAPFSSSCVY